MKENLFEYVLEQLKTKNVTDCYNYLNNNSHLSSKLWDDMLECLFHRIKPREINNINDLAKLLDGNSNSEELSNPYNIDVEDICRKNKWIILFPYSDDNLEVRGYIDDEIGAWDGTKIMLYKKGEFYPEDLDDELYKKASNDTICSIEDDYFYNNEVKNGRLGVDMQWCPNDQPYTWYLNVEYYKKDIDNKPIVAYFDIVDEDDDEDNTWARCCIIDCSNIL